MKRRDLLGAVAAGAGGVLAGCTEENVDGTGTQTRGTTGTPTPPPGDRPSDGRGGGLSFRALGEVLDPVRPARRLRGWGPPETRRARHGEPCSTGDCTDTWTEDTSQFHWADDSGDGELDVPIESVERAVVDTAYDYGMAHRLDKGIVEQHRHDPAQVQSGGYAIRDLADRHEAGRTVRWLVYNAKLQFVAVAGDADFHDRKKELANVLLQERYDVAVLCEAFVTKSNDPIRAIASILDDAGKLVGVHAGPPPFVPACAQAQASEINGGLATFVLDHVTGPSPELGSANRGLFRCRDLTGADKANAKGWLYTEIDLGPGRVDLFQSHTNSGGNDEDMAAKFANLLALFEAVETHAKPENVTVVAGDLNVETDWTEYARLLWMAAQTDGRFLQDAWLTHGGIEDATTFGGTDNAKNWSQSDLAKRCAGYFDDCVCDDYVETGDDGATTFGDRYERVGRRLDYVFVEQPREAHTMNFDIKRLRRRAFPRSTGEGCTIASDDDNKKFNYLSDHFGVEMETVVSPKR